MAATVCCEAEQGQADKGDLCPGSIMDALNRAVGHARTYITFVLVSATTPGAIFRGRGKQRTVTALTISCQNEDAASYCHVAAEN